MAFTNTYTVASTTPSWVDVVRDQSHLDRNTRTGRLPHRTLGAQSTPSANHECPATDPIHVMVDHDTEMQAADSTNETVCAMEPIVLSKRSGTGATTATPAIPIAKTPSASRSRSRMRDDSVDAFQGIEKTPKADTSAQLTGRAKRKKKKAQKKEAEPALNTVRGFTPTPLPSGDEDSDFSPSKFRRRDISLNTSLASSPYLRPVSRAGSVTGGISALRQQLDSLDLEPVPGDPAKIRNKSRPESDTPSSPSMTSTSGSGFMSDAEPVEMTSYEVPLDEDFISQEAEEDTNDPCSSHMALDNLHRKMAAVDFEPLTCLGKGTFGTVNLVKHVATGRLYAQKMFRKASLTVHKALVEQTKTERAILESINCHPFVVKLYYAFQDQEKLYLILEYAQGGELFTHLASERMFPEDTASFYMAEMVLALEHLHQTVGVVYRDLKPENCLLDAEGHLLLTDFGLSKVALDGQDRCNSILGTIEYMAPEVILGHFYGVAVDWWSFGALGFDLLTGGPPFRANNHAKIQEKILKSKLVLPYFLSPDAKDLLTRFLRKEPGKRLGANGTKDLVTIKKHRFFRKIDWKRLERRELEPPIRPLVTDPELAENFSAEFTGLALSPVVERYGNVPWESNEGSEGADPFGGFSFVASKSLLERERLW